MKLRTRSILQELNEIADRRDKDSLIESEAMNIINSAINLMVLINKHDEPEVAQELERRFINSIKGADTTKFTRGIRKITESKRSRKDENVG